jgi:hypothetical protein
VSLRYRKLGVVGSRDYPEPEEVRRFVRRLAELRPDVVVVSGGAKGKDQACNVDKLAVVCAKECGLAWDEIHADWSLGRQAGPIRNSQLVEEVDRVVAFWDGESDGTRDTINKARRAGKLLGVKLPGRPWRR